MTDKMTTPVAKFVSHLLSHGTAGQDIPEILALAESAFGKVQRSLEDKRKWERERKAAYRAGLSQNVPGTKARVSTSIREELPLVTKKESKKDSPPNVPVSHGTSDWPKDFREIFWKAFPRKTEKKAAMAKLEAIEKSGKVAWAIFAAGINRYRHHVAATEERYIKHPTTWLNKGCWEDEFSPNRGSPNGTDRNGGREKLGYGGIAETIRRNRIAANADGASAGHRDATDHSDIAGHRSAPALLGRLV